MTMPAIEVHDLHYRYDDGTVALDGVDFCLHSGETIALLGPNGSGKTTFVLHLNGLLHGQGRVVVCGLAAVKENLAVIRQKVGLVFQDSDNQLFMPTVMDDVSFGPLNLGIPRERAAALAHAALHQVGDEQPGGEGEGRERGLRVAGVADDAACRDCDLKNQVDVTHGYEVLQIHQTAQWNEKRQHHA